MLYIKNNLNQHVIGSDVDHPNKQYQYRQEKQKTSPFPPLLFLRKTI